MKTSIAIVDDHRLFAQALADLIHKFDNYEVLFFAENGRNLIHCLERGETPEIVLLDLRMPEMDGFETALYLKQHYPSVKVIALSMQDREEDIVRVVRNGARGYLLKTCRPMELRKALEDIHSKGFHYSEFLTEQLIRNLSPQDASKSSSAYMNLNERELTFVKLSCSDYTYAEIADKMCVSVRTVDGYRESVFEKMQVKSRAGMVTKAIRLGIA